jgi:hypothetical protein
LKPSPRSQVPELRFDYLSASSPASGSSRGLSFA